MRLNPELMMHDGGGEIDTRITPIDTSDADAKALASKALVDAQAAADAAAAQAAADAARRAAEAKAIADAKIAADKAIADANAAAAAAILAANQKRLNNFQIVPPTPIRQVESTPLTPSLMPTATMNMTPVASSIPVPPAKTAPIDTVLFNDDSVPIEVMTDLIFENIGGQELINISRNDIVNGQKISYSPIKNLVSIQQQYNPNNLISLQSTSDKYFANFSIKLEEKVPNEGSGPNGTHVYIEESTGDLIIETVNINSDEQLDIEIAISGTIYEADI